jgi:hypothetical protein
MRIPSDRGNATLALLVLANIDNGNDEPDKDYATHLLRYLDDEETLEICLELQKSIFDYLSKNRPF